MEFALALALALPAGGPVDNAGVERTEDGWEVRKGRPVVWFGDAPALSTPERSTWCSAASRPA